MSWIVNATSSNVHTVTFTEPFRNKDWEQWVLNISDVHFDSVLCDRKLLLRHLVEARKRNAPIFVNGDFFDAMQGKYDPRRSYSDLRPEYVGPNARAYYDAIVHDAVKTMKPYADLLTVFGYGNHESSVDKNANTDILAAFVEKINEPETPVFTGGYGGWIFWRFKQGDTNRGSSTVKMKYFHGAGGGAPVTLGTIQGQRMLARYPTADILTTGHVHNKWAVTRSREMITPTGRVYTSNQLQICTASYKEDWGDGSGNWHVERGADPKPLGGYWLRFTCERDHVEDTVKVQTQAMEAI